jgi:predicted nucleic acid-binding protein
MEDQKKTSDKQKVFVDADAFVAIAREDDANNEKALSLLSDLSEKPVQFVTSNFVFSESITVISQRLSHQAALAFIDKIKSSHPQFLVHYVDEQIEDMAITVFREQTSKNVSFVDCTNMALVRKHEINYIFSFDAVYRKNGFRTIEDLIAK